MAAWGLAGLAAALMVACLGSGCSVGYLAQSVGGHLDLVNRARPVDEWIADPATPADLRQRLQLSQRMRDFAVTELMLPDNKSYRSFADLQRGAAVWNVVAAPELSLTLRTWCFPVVGCVGYRGYFDRSDADALAAELKAQGWEVSVYGVPAYSTLGRTNWLGGDPLLNTFVRWPEGELARLLFHELAHQVVYVDDDTTFNESFATAVERIGARRWLASQAGEAARAEYAALDGRRNDFRGLVRRARERLDAVYRGGGTAEAQRAQKTALMSELRAEHARLKAERWGGFAGYDPWFERANNASLGVQAAYDELVPAFERLFAQVGGDLERFYSEVRRIAALPKGERRATLGAEPVMTRN